MEISQIIQLYQEDARTKQIVDALSGTGLVRLHLFGLVGAQESLVAAALFKALPKNHFFILPNKEEAAYFQNNLKNLLEKKDLLFFPDSFKKAGKLEEINKGNILLRAECVNRLINSNTSGELIITYPEALFEKVVDAMALQENIIHIQINEKLDADFIMEVLVEYGFERVDFVYEPGEFSIRGGIVDIFSFGNEWPYRVELFDDEVESIRTFDPVTQESTKKIAKVTIVPDIQKQFKSDQKISIFKLLPADTTVWIKDAKGLGPIIESCYEKAIELAKGMGEQLQSDDSPFKGNPEDTFMGALAVLEDLQKHSIIAFGDKGNLEADEIEYEGSPQPAFNKNFDLLIKDLRQKERSGYTNILFTESPRQIRRFQHIFEDLGANVKIDYVAKSINQGFIDDALRLVVYTDHQVFDRYYKYQTRKAYSKQKAISLKVLRELQPGDFVTHIDHGIGVYSGLEKIEVNGKTQEAVRLVYRDKDLLYVGIQSLHKISKYIGKDGRKPKLNKIGSDAWEAVKRKTKRKIKDIAKDLIKLYAKRKASKGFAFAPDTYLQTEVEASFIYEDTPDQLKATQDFKRDMEAENPMDRLICGDVGFGKTEIAVRAAAKAVADNKQVAVLVPTTILALQHYKTFKERLKDFPANIDYLNRFKTAKEKRETIEKINNGEVDIAIGTHALLSKKILFKDLGLFIIDEEQKFGVAAKEKLRALKANVDTLTLTATPIPRTLQFSLMGARDLSIMQTPPPNRQPVTTELVHFDDEKLREAINYEVFRGGQVFFIYNRVKDIKDVGAMIQKLCPDVDVGIAHGQMEGKQLEKVIMKFINREFDVLLCTNIVENGIDIPNANTIIIYHANNFGLSDLHQLRGRVGRSNKKAFCYLVSPPLHTLPDDSRKRLRTLTEFADLGSGFNISMRDLDIRGAGNMLGGEQSGFIADIGYETYQKILAEAIQELKESDFKDLFKDEIIRERTYVRDCLIETDLEMLIPDEYVRNINERMVLYKKLDAIKTEEALQEFKKQLADRFGKIPQSVKELFNALRLRWIAERLGFERILLKKRKLRCYFLSNQQSPFFEAPIFTHILAFIQSRPELFHMKQTNKYLLLVVDQVYTMRNTHKLLKSILDYVEAQEKTTV